VTTVEDKVYKEIIQRFGKVKGGGHDTLHPRIIDENLGRINSSA